MKTIIRDGQTFEHAGRRYRLNIERDDVTDETPWDNDEAALANVVSDWQGREYASDDALIVATDRYRVRLFDKAQCAGNLVNVCGVDPSKAENEADKLYERVRQWCDDVWFYCGVVVTLLDSQGEDTNEASAIWGIESDDEAYISELALEHAAEIAARLETLANEWPKLANRMQWDYATQAAILDAFIREKGLQSEFLAYAQERADDDAIAIVASGSR